VVGTPVTRAVVLGAGGPAGIAWEVGIMAGLADVGIDVREADLLIGTSAGSVVVAGLASAQGFEELFAEQVEPARQVSELRAPVEFGRLRHDLAAAKEGGGSVSEILQRVGAVAAAARTVPEARRRSVIASRLAIHRWPERELRVVAVDVESGERMVFDAASGVDFADAVAASCAVPGVWPPVTIGGRRYMDGGAYSTDNADLAAGCDRVLIFALRARSPRLAVVSLESAVEALRASGAEVDVVHPDAATEAVLASVGGNLLDPSVREGAARAGREQGRRIAASGLMWVLPS
jgi:NTE family protein